VYRRGSLYFRRVNAEFNVWLLIVGLVIGAGLVWLVVMDSRRREAEVDAIERPREAAWLSSALRDDGFDVSPEAVERALVLHRIYLEAPPPDGVTEREAIEDERSEDAARADGPPGSELADENRRRVDR
jgi:hypothetical protein